MTTSNRFNERYTRSQELLSRARESVPGQAQTFSKAWTQYPLGAAPVFAAKADGGRVWDADGNEFTIGRWRLGRCYWGTIIRPSTRPFAIGLILGSLFHCQTSRNSNSRRG